MVTRMLNVHGGYTGTIHVGCIEPCVWTFFSFYIFDVLCHYFNSTAKYSISNRNVIYQEILKFGAVHLLYIVLFYRALLIWFANLHQPHLGPCLSRCPPLTVNRFTCLWICGVAYHVICHDLINVLLKGI